MRAQKGEAPTGAPPKGGSPKFRPEFTLYCSLGVFSWNFGGVFEVSVPSNMHVWSSLGHRVGAPAAWSGGAAGVSYEDPESPWATLQKEIDLEDPTSLFEQHKPKTES